MEQTFEFPLKRKLSCGTIMRTRIERAFGKYSNRGMYINMDEKLNEIRQLVEAGDTDALKEFMLENMKTEEGIEFIKKVFS